MIQKSTINDLYTTYADAPSLFEDRGHGMLIDYALDTDLLDLDGDRLVFNGVDPASPFRSVEVERIHGARDLGSHLAVVMPSAIFFVNKANGDVRMHLKDAEALAV